MSIEQRMEACEARIQAIMAGLNQILTDNARIDNAEKEQKDAIDLSGIRFVETNGPRGIYERSEDIDNLEFKKLVKTLAEHNKKMIIDNYFVWLFENGSTVGRKKRSK
jgi:hypothetical protein